MIKKLLAVSLVVLGIGLTGCLTDPEESTTPTITGPSSSITLELNSPEIMTIKVEASDSITNLSYVITNSSGTEVTSLFTVIPNFTENKAKSKTLQLTLVAPTGTDSGTYYLKVSASTDIEATASFEFVVNGSSTTVSDITEETVTLGAFANSTTGSSIDLDNGTILFSAAAKLANSGVDILYTYSEKTNGSVIMNPVYASDSSGISAFQDWVSPNDTKFHVVNVDYDEIQTAAEIEALFNESSATAKRLSVNAGDVIVVQTDEGNYVLLQIVSVFANKSATAQIKYAR